MVNPPGRERKRAGFAATGTRISRGDLWCSAPSSDRNRAPPITHCFNIFLDVRHI
jgi:hypothetical protein